MQLLIKQTQEFSTKEVIKLKTTHTHIDDD